MTSIFTIKPRQDFNGLFTSFMKNLQSTKVEVGIEEYTMFDYLNRSLRYWPHRSGAKSMTDYLEQRGVDLNEKLSGNNSLLFLELVINLLYWAPKQEIIDKSVEEDGLFSLAKTQIQIESERLLDDVEYLLEQCCDIWIREEEAEEFPKYFITKRNASVDATALAVPELSDLLLGYFDLRNENDEFFKRSVLIEMYRYMDNDKNTYKSLACSSIFDEFSAAMNKFDIRHGDAKQIELENPIELYDKLFLMGLYVLQTKNVIKLKDEVKALRTRA